MHYEYVVRVGRKSEVIIQSTKEYNVGLDVGLVIDPESIHIMKKEVSANIYDDAWINNKNQLMIGEAAFDVDVTTLLKGSSLSEDGYLIGPDAQKYDLNDLDVIATVEFSAPQISDNEEEGQHLLIH